MYSNKEKGTRRKNERKKETLKVNLSKDMARGNPPCEENIKLAQTFVSVFTLLLGVPSCHSNKNSSRVLQSEQGVRVLWSGHLWFFTASFSPKLIVHKQQFLNIIPELT